MTRGLITPDQSTRTADVQPNHVINGKAADNIINMLRLLEVTYDNLTTVFAERYGKGPFLAGVLYREFYKKLNPQAWQASAIAASPGLARSVASDDGV